MSSPKNPSSSGAGSVNDEAMREAARKRAELTNEAAKFYSAWADKHFGFYPYRQPLSVCAATFAADFAETRERSAYLRGRREGMEEILKLASDWEKFPYANIPDIVKEIRAKLAEEEGR